MHLEDQWRNTWIGYNVVLSKADLLSNLSPHVFEILPFSAGLCISVIPGFSYSLPLAHSLLLIWVSSVLETKSSTLYISQLELP